MNDDAPSTAETSGTKGDAPAPPATAFDPDPAEPTGSARADDLDARSGGAGGGFGAPIDTDFPTAPTKGGLTAALVAIGSGLLGAGVVISGLRSRHDSDIDWSTYAVGLAATVALLALAFLGAAVVGRRSGGQARGDLVTWPGVVGILATAPMIEVGLGPDHGGSWEPYLLGGVIAVLGAVGYVVARRPAFVVVAILGLGVVYAQAFDDVTGDSFKGHNHVVVVAVAVTVFVVAITVLGWFLPSRAITGVTVGAVGLLGVGGAMLVLLAERMLAGAFGQFASMLPGSDGGASSSSFSFGPKISANPADYTGEVTWILVCAGVLTLLWALAALVSDHSGFKVLAVAMPAVAVPAGTAVLAVQHPTWWEVGLAVAGGLLVLAALGLARRKARVAEGM